MKLSKSTETPETDIIPAPPIPSMLSETQLINEICECVSVGASDVAICRALGISPGTFVEWKKKGRDGQEPYRTFYIRYEQAIGEREIEWLREIRDPKWHLTHNPRTKNAYAEVRYMKEEKVNTEKLNAKKDAIGAEIDKYFGESDDLGDEGSEGNGESDSEEPLP
jgi:hypothetical protein